MKKSLIALAVVGAFAGTAQAQQSSVSIYGVVDGGIRYTKNVNAAGDDNWGLAPQSGGPFLNSQTGFHLGNYNTNRLGFKGVEDLGGGMNAHFVLENGFDETNGTLDNPFNRLFSRTALVGIGGSWGSLDLGRQYSVAFKTIGTYDPFNYHYTQIIPLSGAAAGNNSGNTATNPFGVLGGTRFNNDVQYTGNFGPVTARAEYSFGEQAGAFQNGQAWALGTGFATGPVSVGAAYTKKRPNVSTTATPSFQDNTQWTVGGAVKVGDVVRVAAGYINEKQEAALTVVPDTKLKNAWAGVTFYATPAAEVTAAFYQTKVDLGTGVGTTTDGKRNLFMVGATYALSKRTTLYTEVDHSKLDGVARVGATTATPQDKQTGFSVGVSHLF